MRDQWNKIYTISERKASVIAGIKLVNPKSFLAQTPPVAQQIHQHFFFQTSLYTYNFTVITHHCRWAFPGDPVER